jgi:hypothetical protein
MTIGCVGAVLSFFLNVWVTVSNSKLYSICFHQYNIFLTLQNIDYNVLTKQREILLQDTIMDETVNLSPWKQGIAEYLSIAWMGSQYVETYIGRISTTWYY